MASENPQKPSYLELVLEGRRVVKRSDEARAKLDALWDEVREVYGEDGLREMQAEVGWED